MVAVLVVMVVVVVVVEVVLEVVVGIVVEVGVGIVVGVGVSVGVELDFATFTIPFITQDSVSEAYVLKERFGADNSTAVTLY